MKPTFFCLIVAIIFYSSCSFLPSSPKNLTQDQETVLYYLFNKSLVSDTFSRMIWKLPIDFRGYDSEKDLLYFFCKKDIKRSLMLSTITKDTQDVEFAPCESGFCEFGGLSGDITGYHVFRTSPQNLKIQSNQKISCKLNKKKMSISLDELHRLKDTLSMYNYKKYALIPTEIGSIPVVNVGAYISKKGKDEYVAKLAKELTQNCNSKEEKAQKLLDFVCNEITYSYADYWYRTEITKRAHEVILSGFGDCSGKSTLYASLLEASDIPYCLLYFKNHVNVGVAGQFASNNPYTFSIDNTMYHMAETTIPDFVIGSKKYILEDVLTHVLFYHIPSKTKSCIDAITHSPLQLLDEHEITE